MFLELVVLLFVCRPDYMHFVRFEVGKKLVCLIGTTCSAHFSTRRNTETHKDRSHTYTHTQVLCRATHANRKDRGRTLGGVCGRAHIVYTSQCAPSLNKCIIIRACNIIANVSLRCLPGKGSEALFWDSFQSICLLYL